MLPRTTPSRVARVREEALPGESLADTVARLIDHGLERVKVKVKVKARR